MLFEPRGKYVEYIVSKPMIGQLLGSANQKSTARYAHLDDEHVLDTAEQIGAAIKRMTDG